MSDARQARLARLLLAAAILLFFVLPLTRLHAEEGIASVYGSESGSRRADGKPFRPSEIGCASRTLRLGTTHRVTVIATGRSILCPVNDYGPAAWTHRLLDLSVAAARALGVGGLARVRVE